ncbi:hypothetical protein C8T65DRAFT_743672 [Cerioporus squamosus]|nr:hypothetical protein C8T65DRAFT_743672 [Cerioporus squamosus]
MLARESHFSHVLHARLAHDLLDRRARALKGGTIGEYSQSHSFSILVRVTEDPLQANVLVDIRFLSGMTDTSATATYTEPELSGGGREGTGHRSAAELQGVTVHSSPTSIAEPCDHDGMCDCEEGRPVWVYVNYVPTCCTERGAEGVEVVVLAEGIESVTLVIPRCIEHIQAGMHEVRDVWGRYLRENLLVSSTPRQARMIIAAVGCMLYFSSNPSECNNALWTEFDVALADVVSSSKTFKLADRTELLLEPLLLWATSRCQRAIVLPAAYLLPGQSYREHLDM